MPSLQPAKLSRRKTNSAATGVTITGKKRHYIDNGQAAFTVSPGLMIASPPVNRRPFIANVSLLNFSGFAAVHESAIGPKRTLALAPHMSAFGGKADMALRFH